jgi:hypothetical protein
MGSRPLHRRQQFILPHEDELGFVVDEPLDQPRTRDAVDFDVLPSNPSHQRVPINGYCLAAATVFGLPVSLTAALKAVASFSAGPVPQ